MTKIRKKKSLKNLVNLYKTRSTCKKHGLPPMALNVAISHVYMFHCKYFNSNLKYFDT